MNLTRKLFTREGFMGLFIVSVGGIASLIFGVPIVGYMLGPLINQPNNVWQNLGAVDSFKTGETKKVVFEYPGMLSWSGPVKQTAAWLRRDSADKFTAYAVYCTHLGCPVQWVNTAEIFLCPCHGSVFYSDGTVAGGPAPRPLFTYETRVLNGQVQVRTAAQPLAT